MTSEKRKHLLWEMLRIRRVEEAIANLYPRKEIRCPVHLSIGQEACAVGISAALEKSDRIFSNHRCHAHYLAKGGDLPRMMAELFGKATGCSHGKGGSMHLCDPEVGMMGASALVAGTIPMAVGSALALKRMGKPNISVAFLGDGATEEGIFFESLNFAALHRLGVIFVCENNLFATYTPINQRQARTEISEKAHSMGVFSQKIDGNDVELVLAAAQAARDRAREGLGPTLLELMTYRQRDHVGPGDDLSLGYRSESEHRNWLARCPILMQKNRLLSDGLIGADEINQREEKIKEEIGSAVRFAEESPFPSLDEILNDVYTSQI